MKAEITKIQRFSTHDGPGIRTTVFFRGCPLHCFWCHNPETAIDAPKFYMNYQFCIGCGACVKACPNDVHVISDTHEVDRSKCVGCLKCADACPSGAIEKCSFSADAKDIVKTALRDSAFYQQGGGITISGGEPMYQPEACIEVLKDAKEKGLTTAVETCGVFDTKNLENLVKYADILLWDYKDGDAKRLKANTGADLDYIEKNLISADSLGAVTELHCIMIHGVNTDEKNYSAIAEIYKKLTHCKGVKLTPYHPYGSSKAIRLSLPDTTDKGYIPSPEEISEIEKYLTDRGVKIIK